MTGLWLIACALSTLAGAVFGGAIAITAYRRGKLDVHDRVQSPCPTCGSVEVVDFDPGDRSAS